MGKLCQSFQLGLGSFSLESGIWQKNFLVLPFWLPGATQVMTKNIVFVQVGAMIDFVAQ